MLGWKKIGAQSIPNDLLQFTTCSNLSAHLAYKLLPRMEDFFLHFWQMHRRLQHHTRWCSAAACCGMLRAEQQSPERVGVHFYKCFGMVSYSLSVG